MNAATPQAILVLPRLRVQNANAISSPLTHGFPSITAFTGLMWALERKLSQAGISTVQLALDPIRTDPGAWPLRTVVKSLADANISVASAMMAMKGEDYSTLKSIEVVTKVSDPLILNTLAEDTSESHESALLKIYARLRPGNPPQLDKAQTLFEEKFFDENRYRLGRVGRFRINRKFDQNVPESVMTLRSEDFVNSLKYMFKLRSGEVTFRGQDYLLKIGPAELLLPREHDLRAAAPRGRRAGQGRLGRHRPDGARCGRLPPLHGLARGRRGGARDRRRAPSGTQDGRRRQHRPPHRRPFGD